MKGIKDTQEKEEPVYLKVFGSFIIKNCVEKATRNISRYTTMIVLVHNVPVFKPTKE